MPPAGRPGSGGVGVIRVPRAAAPSLALGANALAYTQELQGLASLSTGAMNVPSGSVVIAWPAMGVLANIVAPTDSAGNTYSALLPPHNYQGWASSGMRPYAATGVVGASNLVVTESMATNNNDEVTLSTVVVQGGSVIHADVAEQPTTSSPPIATPSLTTSGPAILLSSWWGDGATVQDSATPSAGWTKLHELNSAIFTGGCIQTALAYRVVSSAGTYNCSWTSSPDQGGVVYIVSVE